MRTTALLTSMVIGLLASQALAQAAPLQLQTDEERIIYSLGHSFGKQLNVFHLSAAEIQILQRGIADGATGAPPATEVEKYSQRVQGLAKGRQGKVNEAHLEKAAQEKGAVKLPSGVVYRELKAGTGSSPKPKDTVAVHYRGTLLTGEEFDSSYRRSQVAEFPLNGVIPCWTEGLQQMKVGGKAKLTCPARTAYGDRPPPGSKITPNAVLEFEVELVGIPGDTSKK
jgi:FKBP-type peptidyl-prolyl cis-trans isomerase FkpA